SSRPSAASSKFAPSSRTRTSSSQSDATARPGPPLGPPRGAKRGRLATRRNANYVERLTTRDRLGPSETTANPSFSGSNPEGASKITAFLADPLEHGHAGQCG